HSYVVMAPQFSHNLACLSLEKSLSQGAHPTGLKTFATPYISASLPRLSHCALVRRAKKSCGHGGKVGLFVIATKIGRRFQSVLKTASAFSGFLSGIKLFGQSKESGLQFRHTHVFG